MEDALNAGQRRRSLAVMATPIPMKRPLHKSPAASVSGSTVTPVPKRHMSESGSETKSEAFSSSSKTADAVMPGVELFPATEVQDTLVLEDSQMETPEEGWEWKLLYKCYIVYIYYIYIYIYYYCINVYIH